MESKTNRSEFLILGLIFFIPTILLTSIVLAAFGIWNWFLAVIYALSVIILASCVFERKVIVKSIVLFIILEAAQLIPCWTILVIRGLI